MFCCATSGELRVLVVSAVCGKRAVRDPVKGETHTRAFTHTQTKMRFTILVILAASCSSEPAPGGTCGWPSLHPGGLFGASTVRLAQRLLGHALLQPGAVADGVFTATTTSAIEKFQKMAGINASESTSGYLNAGTWPKLVSASTTLADSPQLILAAQDALTANGFATPLTGVLDATTVQSLGAFQRQRGAPVQPPGSADAATWHLLATGCNRPGGAFWFDAGWPQGNMSVPTLACLREHGFEFATFECWVEQSHEAGAPTHRGSFWHGKKAAKACMLAAKTGL